MEHRLSDLTLAPVMRVPITAVVPAIAVAVSAVWNAVTAALTPAPALPMAPATSSFITPAIFGPVTIPVAVIAATANRLLVNHAGRNPVRDTPRNRSRRR